MTMFFCLYSMGCESYEKDIQHSPSLYQQNTLKFEPLDIMYYSILNML